MILAFDDHGWDDYLWWQEHDRTTLKRVNRLIRDALRDPAGGIGKPELLRYGAPDTWSRRITEEHRLVYRVVGDTLIVIAARFHYV
ncbi:MAG: Txe/YoeB family addiction module toxin [Propionibacteriaceae bacterium]|nr:Txe/YoeB family addiction module toxin [Propionibacteriaceae bacterium]